jgi:hypothetical protein
MSRYWDHIAIITGIMFLSLAPAQIQAQVGELGNLQALVDKGRVKGVASMRTRDKLYLAV